MLYKYKLYIVYAYIQYIHMYIHVNIHMYTILYMCTISYICIYNRNIKLEDNKICLIV